MAAVVALNTPLSEQLTTVVQPKLVEVGWSTGGQDDTALAEYIILMLANGKTQDQIASELANDLLNLGPEDTNAAEFARWLFEQVDVLSGRRPAQPTEPIVDVNANGQAIQNEAEIEEERQDDDMMDEGADASQADGSIPTGPKSMRNGPTRGNQRRILGQINRAMDRSSDAALHRVRNQGGDRIGRPPPKGPSARGGRGGSMSIRGHASMNGAPHGPRQQNGAGMASITPQQQMAVLQIMEQQAKIFSQILTPQQQQLIGAGLGAPGGLAQNVRYVPGGKQERGGYAGRGGRRGGFNGGQSNGEPKAEGEDASMDMDGEASQQQGSGENGELLKTVCKFNHNCTKADCHFAHQSPAAPPGTQVDVNDVCSFGVACVNATCRGSHPSPARKRNHQAEQDCKFFPNCTNPNCPFRHPTMPLCRNGADCTTPNCKFTHLSQVCKYNPCLNGTCPYKHAPGQKGARPGHNVWTPELAAANAAAAAQGQSQEDEDKKHVSERKFVDGEAVGEELITPGQGKEVEMGLDVVS